MAETYSARACDGTTVYSKASACDATEKATQVQAPAVIPASTAPPLAAQTAPVDVYNNRKTELTAGVGTGATVFGATTNLPDAQGRVKQAMTFELQGALFPSPGRGAYASVRVDVAEQSLIVREGAGLIVEGPISKALDLNWRLSGGLTGGYMKAGDTGTFFLGAEGGGSIKWGPVELFARTAAMAGPIQPNGGKAIAVMTNLQAEGGIRVTFDATRLLGTY